MQSAEINQIYPAHIDWMTLLSVMLMLSAAGGCSRKHTVETVRPRHGYIRDSFTEPARTRPVRTWTVSAPLIGRIGRIDIEPGDRVEAGKLLASYDIVPFEARAREAEAGTREAEAAVKELEAALSELDIAWTKNADRKLEETSRKQLDAYVASIEENVAAIDVQIESAEARLAYAETNLRRIENLAGDNSVSEQAGDDAKLAADTARLTVSQLKRSRASQKAMLAAVKLGPQLLDKYLSLEDYDMASISEKKAQVAARLSQARARLEQANARLEACRHEKELAAVKAPISGVVLQKLDSGGRAVAAGTPLLVLADLSHLEVVADVLTTDAVSLSHSSVVIIEGLPDGREIRRKVKRIEPAGFTKISSLGVEQQRVRVIVSTKDLPAGIGAGYRLTARFVRAEKRDTLVIPRSSVMETPDGRKFVFRIASGRMKTAPVETGLSNDREMEILAGLSDGDIVVRSPDATMKDGDGAVSE